MSDKFKWLQFFADGASGGDGDGGDGADAGVTTADARRSLEELGVPREKAERFRARKAKAGKAGGDTSSAAAAAPSPQGEGKSGPSWDEFFANPDNKQKLQSMMAERA